MPLEHSEYQAIKKEILEEADERYVKIEDCNEKQNQVNAKFANDDKRIDKLIDRMDLWNKLLWVITSSSIAALVVAFFNLILK
jgi:DNA repair exonuclease SbcCD ATPase subunit